MDFDQAMGKIIGKLLVIYMKRLAIKCLTDIGGDVYQPSSHSAVIPTPSGDMTVTVTLSIAEGD